VEGRISQQQHQQNRPIAVVLWCCARQKDHIKTLHNDRHSDIPLDHSATVAHSDSQWPQRSDGFADEAIYDQIADLTVRIFQLISACCMIINPFIKLSFGALMKLHEVTQYDKFITVFADA